MFVQSTDRRSGRAHAMRTVFFVSDSTGITAETMGHSLLAQFDNLDFRQVSIPFVSDPARARAAVERIESARREDGDRPIVFSTLANADIYEVVSQADALVLDLFSMFIRQLEREFERGSTHATGRFHGLVDRASYEVRIDAVDFALSHDDGASTRHYEAADLVLIGVSRSGKTPTCIYLAMQYGIRAANYPLTEDDLDLGRLPEALVPHRSRLYGLSIDADRLHQLRGERRPNSRYASSVQCRREVREVDALYRSHAIPHIDTSSISIEEIATRLLQETGLQRRIY